MRITNSVLNSYNIR